MIASVLDAAATVLAYLLLLALAVGAAMVWRPAVAARIPVRPWWVVAGVPAGTLALVAVLVEVSALRVSSGLLGDLVNVLAVAVSVTGGRVVTEAMLRGAERSGMPDIIDPAEPLEHDRTEVLPSAGSAPDAGPSATVPVAPGPGPAAPTTVVPVTEASPVTEQSPVTGRQVLRGGVWIGVLERAAITTCLLTGLVEGVALVLAVKGLGRYSELRTPGAAERFIIGTFSSLLWAGAAAGVALLFR